MDDAKNISKELAFYRLERAGETLEEARLLIANDRYRAANNRSYYSIFHSLRAALAVYGFDSKKHSGIISEFRKRYLKPGLLPVEISKMISDAYEIRNSSDYDDMYIVNKDLAREQVVNAEYILKTVKGYIESYYLG